MILRRKNRLWLPTGFTIILGSSAFFLYKLADKKNEPTYISSSGIDQILDQSSVKQVASRHIDANPTRYPLPCDPLMSVVVVACGKKSLRATLILLKSILIFSKCPLTLIVFTEPVFGAYAKESIRKLLEVSAFGEKKIRRKFIVKDLVYPNRRDLDEQLWYKMYSPCSTFRLFLPDILFDRDSTIYLDSDTLLLSPLEELWDILTKMPAEQIAALSAEHQHRKWAWYGRVSKIPFVLPFGVNSGVILMNLTRMRDFNWTAGVLSTYQQYKSELVTHDQDLINIIFHKNPDRLAPLSCEWNFRVQAHHCDQFAGKCEIPQTSEAGNNGLAKLLHGNSGSFFDKKKKFFYGIYSAFRKLNPKATDLKKDLMEQLTQTILNNTKWKKKCPALDMQLITKLQALS